MPRFLNQITENGNSVPSSNNNSVTNIMYVTQEEFDTLVEQNKLIEKHPYLSTRSMHAFSASCSVHSCQVYSTHCTKFQSPDPGK